MRSDWPNNAPARGRNFGAAGPARVDSASRHFASPLPGGPPPALAAPQLLIGVRRSLCLDIDGLAARIGVNRATVQALEDGRLDALPPWPETARIVGAWIALAGIDPRPALSELAAMLRPASPLRFAAAPDAAPPAAGGRQSQRAGGAATAAATAAAETDARIAAVARVLSNRDRPQVRAEENPSRAAADAEQTPPAISLRARLGEAIGARPSDWPGAIRRLVVSRLTNPPARVWSLGAVVLALLTLWGAAINTSVVASAVSVLPAPAGRAVRSLSDTFAEWLAPVREGHRWIEVADPRSRRADKLRITPRSD